jgi:polysaccharide biosynthesis protein PslG
MGAQMFWSFRKWQTKYLLPLRRQAKANVRSFFIMGALVLTFASATIQAQVLPTLGINALWIPGDSNSLRERFRKARALGIKEVRLDWEWRQVEKKQGEYQWEKLDLLVKTAREEGISLLPIVHYAPDWAILNSRKADDVYELAPRADSYADFAKFMLNSIRRYGPGGNAPVPFTPIKYWQAWNEPNLRQFWGPRPDPAGFARMMQKVQEVLAPVRSQIQIVHAGLSKIDIEFMWQLWDANTRHGDTFDVFAVHPYLYDGNDGIREPEAIDKDDSKAGPMGFVGSIKDSGYMGKIFNIQLFMTLRGSPGKPIWITEMGYFIAKHRLGVDEAQQGIRLTRTVEFIRKKLTDQRFGEGARAIPANVQRLYWFSLEDYPSPEGLGTFGLFRPDGTLRPSGEALRKYNR